MYPLAPVTATGPSALDIPVKLSLLSLEEGFSSTFSSFPFPSFMLLNRA